MSECLSKYDQIKLNGVLKVDSNHSPTLNKEYIDKAALTLTVNNLFLKELQKARYKFSDFSLVSILNSQLTAFQLKDTERLNSRLSRVLYGVSKLYKTKYSGGRNRAIFDLQETRITVFHGELENVKELNIKITKFSMESLQWQEKARDLWNRLQAAESVRENESDFTTTIHSLKEENNKLTEYIESFQKEVVLKNTGKTLEELHPNARRRKIVSLEKVSQKALWFAKSFGLNPQSIRCETKDGETCSLNLTSTPKSTKFSDLAEKEKLRLRELVTIMDRFHISTTAYKELSFYFDDMPRSYLIGQCRDDINSFFHIERTPGNVPGAYLSITDEIQKAIKNRYKDSDDRPSKIRLKFSGDGTRVTRVSNFIVFTFSFIDDEQKCGGESNTVGLISCSETYDNLKTACSPILAEINDLNSKGKISVFDEDFDLEIFIGGDMKFIQLLLGLCGSTGIHCCPWCKVSKSDRADTSKPWDFYHSTDNARTTSNLKNSYFTKTFGAKNRTLINVEPHHIVIDELHLLLRIFDILLRNVIDDAVALDQSDDVDENIAGISHLDSLVAKIRSCGVTFNTWTSKSGQLDWTSLTGNDAKKFLRELPRKLFFDINSQTHDDVVKLWEDFDSIHTDICKESIELKHPNDIFIRCKLWVEKFLKIGEFRDGYQPQNVTPYMHALLYHVPFFISKYGHLGRFSGQTVEKNNDVIKKVHMTQTNKYDGTVDALKVTKRREWCMEQGYVREKRSYGKTSSYWENEIYSTRAAKKHRILSEIKEKSQCVKELFGSELEIKAIDDYSSMTVQELKGLLKERGIVTKIRKHEKLVKLLQDID